MITKGVAQVCVPDVSPPLSYTRVFPHCLEVGTKQWATSVVVADDSDDNWEVGRVVDLPLHQISYHIPPPNVYTMEVYPLFDWSAHPQLPDIVDRHTIQSIGTPLIDNWNGSWIDDSSLSTCVAYVMTDDSMIVIGLVPIWSLVDNITTSDPWHHKTFCGYGTYTKWQSFLSSTIWLWKKLSSLRWLFGVATFDYVVDDGASFLSFVCTDFDWRSPTRGDP